LCCLGCVIGLLHERIVLSTGFLAQASMSRLGEINKGSPKLLHVSSRSGDPRSFWASENLTQVRGVSPKRDSTWGYCSPFSSPRLGEGGSPKRDPLAWARSWAKAVWCLAVSCSWMVGTCLDMIVMVKICDERLCMSDVIHWWWMMGLVWTWHVN